MGNLRTRGATAVGAGWAACFVLGCSGTTPPNAIGPPRLDLITVFFPEDNLVRGHGEVGAMPSGVPYLEVDAHPTSTTDHFPVNPDGSFDFDIIALSGDILELSGTMDMSGAGKGDVSYVRVPPGIGARDHYICCGAGTGPGGMKMTGTCQPESAAKKNLPCPDRATGATQCATEAECFRENGENLPINAMGIQISQPNKDGKITITGTGQVPHAMMRLQNRGKLGVGGEDRGVRTAKVMNKDGGFIFKDLPGRGMDELVLQLIDLDGVLSPELPLYVPNAPLEAIDILGAFPYEPLYDGRIGKVAVRLRPRGVDGYGICPDSTADPVLCFNGGLTHDMVSIDTADFDCQNCTVVSHPPATPTSRALPSNRGTEGDPVSGPKAYVLVVDMSDAAGKVDGPSPIRFDAIERFVNALPTNSQVGIVSFGGDPVRMDMITRADPDFVGCNTSTGSMSFGGTSVQIARAFKREMELTPAQNGKFDAAIATLERLKHSAAKGISDVYSAIADGADMLSKANLPFGYEGVIVVVVAADIKIDRQVACIETAKVNTAVGANSSMGTPGFATHIIGGNLTEMGMKTEALNVENLKTIAGFSGSPPFGTYTGVRPLGALGDALAGVNAAIAGDFVLLYDMPIPNSAGKATTLTLKVTANISSQGAIVSKQATYQGPLEIAGAGGNP